MRFCVRELEKRFNTFSPLLKNGHLCFQVRFCFAGEAALELEEGTLNEKGGVFGAVAAAEEVCGGYSESGGKRWKDERSANDMSVCLGGL